MSLEKFNTAQLTFIPESREDRMENEILRLKQQIERIRKGLYAKVTALQQISDTLQHQLETYNQVICKHTSQNIRDIENISLFS